MTSSFLVSTLSRIYNAEDDVDLFFGGGYGVGVVLSDPWLWKMSSLSLMLELGRFTTAWWIISWDILLCCATISPPDLHVSACGRVNLAPQLSYM